MCLGKDFWQKYLCGGNTLPLVSLPSVKISSYPEKKQKITISCDGSGQLIFRDNEMWRENELKFLFPQRWAAK